MLELFAGRMSVSKAFVARGWTVTAIDLVRPAEVPDGIDFVTADVMQLAAMLRRIGVRAEIFGFLDSWEVDFIWAWSGTPARAEAVAKAAEIPPELAACVAEYADRITEDVALIKP